MKLKYVIEMIQPLEQRTHSSKDEDNKFYTSLFFFIKSQFTFQPVNLN